jgi:hypothetical protein
VWSVSFAEVLQQHPTVFHNPSSVLPINLSCPPPLPPFVPPQAKAFALLSEEGIAKGVRRIVAVTASDASAAISEGEKLAAEVEKAAALPDAELEQVRTMT